MAVLVLLQREDTVENFLLVLHHHWHVKVFEKKGSACNKFGKGHKIKRWYVVGSKSFRPDQPFKVTEIKQICYFST